MRKLFFFIMRWIWAQKGSLYFCSNRDFEIDSTRRVLWCDHKGIYVDKKTISQYRSEVIFRDDHVQDIRDNSPKTTLQDLKKEGITFDDFSWDKVKGDNFHVVTRRFNSFFIGKPLFTYKSIEKFVAMFPFEFIMHVIVGPIYNRAFSWIFFKVFPILARHRKTSYYRKIVDFLRDNSDHYYYPCLIVYMLHGELAEIEYKIADKEYSKLLKELREANYINEKQGGYTYSPCGYMKFFETNRGAVIHDTLGLFLAFVALVAAVATIVSGVADLPQAIKSIRL